MATNEKKLNKIKIKPNGHKERFSDKQKNKKEIINQFEIIIFQK